MWASPIRTPRVLASMGKPFNCVGVTSYFEFVILTVWIKPGSWVINANRQGERVRKTSRHNILVCSETYVPYCRPFRDPFSNHWCLTQQDMEPPILYSRWKHKEVLSAYSQVPQGDRFIKENSFRTSPSKLSAENAIQKGSPSFPSSDKNHWAQDWWIPFCPSACPRCDDLWSWISRT